MKAWLKHFFIPHDKNNYAPHSLQKGALLGMLFLVMLSFTASNALSLLWMSSQWMVSTILPAVIVKETNAERLEDNLTALQRNATLDLAATLKAQDMAKKEYFSHYSPDGVSPWYWFDQAQYNFVHAGENLAIHFTDSEAVVEAWMDSPTHRENIMNGNYIEIGIGTASGEYQGFETVYVVQLFGTPAAQVATQAQPTVAGETLASDEQTTDEDTEVLAEAVTLSETVTIEPAKPVAVEIQEPSIDTSELLNENATEAEIIPEVATTVNDMVATETGVALHSNFLATSTGGIPATIEPTGDTYETTPKILELATQPHKLLEGIYFAIATFVFVSLLLSVFIEIRRQQQLQVAYGAGLLTLMFGLLYMHSFLSSGVGIV